MKEERKKEIINSLEMCVNLVDIDLESYFQNLQQLGKNLVKDRNTTCLGRLFNVLGNENRLNILKLLMQKDYCVSELEAILDKSQSSISHHLKLLENEGLIRGIKKGYFTHYELANEKFIKYINMFKQYYPFI
jgi:DNA-binding HxlR family transcriptional regulator